MQLRVCTIRNALAILAIPATEPSANARKNSRNSQNSRPSSPSTLSKLLNICRRLALYVSSVSYRLSATPD